MNKWIGMGRLTRDPDVKENFSQITVAIDRINEGADYIGMKVFGKTKETVDRYLKKGTKILAEAHIQTGSYEREGKRYYTQDLILDRFEFCESKGNTQNNEGFTKADDLADDTLPWN